MDAELLRIGFAGVVPIRWELSKADDPGTLTGWASVYNVVDQQDDVVVPGAFKRSLDRWRASKSVIPLTLDHRNNAEGVIGSLTKAEETAYGLRVTFKFASTPDAQSARAKAREGHLTGLSIFGGVVQKSLEMVGDRAVQVLREVALMFIGLTPIPANEGALVTAAKGAGTLPADLPDLWVADMKAALAISATTVRKAAVDALVRDRYQIESTPTTPPEGGEDAPVETDAADNDDAARYALEIIGESGPRESAPGGDPSTDSLADQLLASIDAVTNRQELQALTEEFSALKGE